MSIYMDCHLVEKGGVRVEVCPYMDCHLVEKGGVRVEVRVNWK